MNFEELLEAKTKTLQKLKKSNAIDVATDYPEEFIRILFSEIEDIGIKLKGKSKKDVLDRFRAKLKDTMSGGNLLLDKNNHLKFTVATEDGGEIEFDLYIEGNVFNWSVTAGKAYNKASDKTSLRGKSVEEALSELLKRLKIVLDSPDWASASVEEYEEYLKKVKRKPSKPAEIAERVARHFGMRGGQEGDKSGRGYQLYIRPTSQIIGIPRDVLNKVEKDFRSAFDVFKYTYQIEQLKKSFEVLVKRLEANKYLITSLGFGGNDYLFVYVDSVNPQRKNPSYAGDHTYQDIHDAMKDEKFYQYVSKIEVVEKTKQEAQRDFIDRVFENLG